MTYQPTEDEQRLLIRYAAQVQASGVCAYPELELHLRHFDQQRRQQPGAQAELHPGDCGQALAILLRNNTKRLQQLRQRCASDSNEQGRTSDCLLGMTVALRHVQRNLQDGFRSFGGALHDPLRRMIGDQLKRAGTLLRRLERGHRHQHPQGLLLGLQQNLLDSFEFLIEQWQTATPT